MKEGRRAKNSVKEGRGDERMEGRRDGGTKERRDGGTEGQRKIEGLRDRREGRRTEGQRDRGGGGKVQGREGINKKKRGSWWELPNNSHWEEECVWKKEVMEIQGVRRPRTGFGDTVF